MDENKDLMKNDSVQSLSYPYLPTLKLPTSVALPMSNLAELGGTVVNKDEDKDAEKDVDENKDLMKNDSVQSLLYPHLPTPKLPTSVALPMSNLAELINNIRSSPSSSSLS